MTDCLFCSVRPADSGEHIVLEALGGRRETRGLLCEPCNNRFGGTIDAELERAFRPMSLMAGCFRGDNKPVASLRGLTDEKGKPFEVHHGGTGRQTKPITVRSHSPKGVRSKDLRHFDEEQIAQILAAEARRLGVSSGDLTVTGTSETGVRKTAVNMDLSFGGRSQYRSVVKMGLAALVREEALIRNSEAETAAAFVNSGDGWLWAIDPQARSVRDALGVSTAQHLLLVHEQAGGWEVLFLGFGIIGLRARLPTPGQEFAGVAHVVSPIDKSHDVVHAPPAVRLTPLSALDHSIESARPMFQELQQWMQFHMSFSPVRATVEQSTENSARRASKHWRTNTFPRSHRGSLAR